jgi:alkaline phosphatase D
LGIDLAIANVEPPKQDSVLVGDLGARLQVIYLEIRRDSSTTLLGKAQWLWLEGELSKPANLRLILSRLPVLADKVGWGAFPAERQRLFSLIAKTQATGVVFISEALDGGAIYREGRGVPAAMFELSASASMLADPDFPDLDPNRLGSLARSPTFGLIDIDWTHRTAQLALHALDGQTLEPVASVPLTTTHPSVLALAVTVPGG